MRTAVTSLGPLAEHGVERRFPRYKTSQRVRAYLLGEDTFYNVVEGNCKEFARGGLGATLKEQLHTGQTVLLQLSLSLKVYATVRFSNGFYHGFEFVLLRDKDRVAIHNLCEAFERWAN